MKKLLKLLFIFTLLLLFLGTFTLIAVTQFVNPNQFKTEIQDLVRKKTHRELSIGGNIHWTFYPWLGLEINELELKDLPQFNRSHFAKLSKIGFKVNFVPLFKGQIRISSIQITDLDLHLVVDKQGQANWEDLLDKPIRTTPRLASPAPEHMATASNPLDLNIEQLLFENATITLDNRQTNTHLLIQKASITANNIQENHRFPIKGQMHLITSPANLDDQLSFKGRVLYDLAQTTLSLQDFSVDQTIKMPDSVPIQESIVFDSTFNWAQGTLRADPIKGAIGPVSFTAKLQGQALFTMPLIKAQIIASLYGGQITNESTLSKSNTHTSGAFENIQIPALSGKIQGAYTFNTQGADVTTLKRNLDGQLSFKMSEGHLTGVDLDYIFAEAKALLKSQKNTKTDTGVTPFGSLTGTLQARKGTFYNKDLTLASAKFTVHGKGEYALPTNQLDYYAEATLNEKGNTDPTTSLKNIPLGIHITGQPPQLQYNPDFATLFQLLLKAQLQKQSTKVLDKLTQDLGGDLGEGAQDAVRRGLGDTLRNLPFKDILKNNQ